MHRAGVYFARGGGARLTLGTVMCGFKKKGI